MPMLAGILLLEVDFRAGWMLMEEILKKKKFKRRYLETKSKNFHLYDESRRDP